MGFIRSTEPIEPEDTYTRHDTVRVPPPLTFGCQTLIAKSAKKVFGKGYEYVTPDQSTCQVMLVAY